MALEDVFDRDKATQESFVVDQWQLLDAVLLQRGPGVFERGADGGGDESLAGHEIGDRPIEIGASAEPDVAVGENANKAAIVIGNGHAAELETVHQRFGFVQRCGGRKRDRIGNHAALAALHLLHFGRLVFDGEVAVDDTDAALACHRNGHGGLGDFVHCRRHERHSQIDVARKHGRGIDRVGQHLAVTGHDDDIVEREGFETIEECLAVVATNGTRSRRAWQGGPPSGAAVCCNVTLGAMPVRVVGIERKVRRRARRTVWPDLGMRILRGL